MNFTMAEKNRDIKHRVRTVSGNFTTGILIGWVKKTFFMFCAVSLHDDLVLLSSGSVLILCTSKSNSSENTFVKCQPYRLSITLCFLTNYLTCQPFLRWLSGSIFWTKRLGENKKRDKTDGISHLLSLRNLAVLKTFIYYMA